MTGFISAIARLSILGLALSGSALADTYCVETVTSIIVHADGVVYFQTNQTCTTNWCSLTYSSATTATNAYALLMTATAQNKQLTFAWSGLASCTAQNAVYATPTIIILNP